MERQRAVDRWQPWKSSRSKAQKGTEGRSPKGGKAQEPLDDRQIAFESPFEHPLNPRLAVCNISGHQVYEVPKLHSLHERDRNVMESQLRAR